jgi:hypothetical protein
MLRKNSIYSEKSICRIKRENCARIATSQSLKTVQPQKGLAKSAPEGYATCEEHVLENLLIVHIEFLLILGV